MPRKKQGKFKQRSTKSVGFAIEESGDRADPCHSGCDLLAGSLGVLKKFTINQQFQVREQVRVLVSLLQMR